jgi:ankyrin repeat protein
VSEKKATRPSIRRLPPQPNLEQLRKQAKELLEQYCAGDPAAIAEVDEFGRNADPAAFALGDAQRVLARSYGYASWTKLKAFVDGVNIARLADAVNEGDLAQVRALLHARPELIHQDMSDHNEHRALHYAVLRRDEAMVRLLMEAGADARKGIYPHRDATSALGIALDREYHEIAAIIEEEERLRREELSCPNATVSPVQEQINRAISRGDNASVVRLLEADKTLIQACDQQGGTPLHIAAEEANEEMLEWLLRRHAPVNKQDVHGLTALDRAAKAADPRNNNAKRFSAIAKLLLGYGTELTMRGAVAMGDTERVRELAAADPASLRNIDRNGGLLTIAAKHGRLEIIRLLLDLGADVDERVLLEELEVPTVSWGMPLWYAALAGDREITQVLLERGADPNANVYASGWPLRNAWSHEDDSVKRLLLAHGAKLHPYMIAEQHDVEGAKRLLAEDASEELARELVVSAADHGCLAIVTLALGRLPWPATDHRWHWVLIQPIRGASGDSAANDGHFACLAALLKHGIEPNVARYGQTAVHFAAAYRGPVGEEDRARFASLLLDYGARLDIRDDLLRSTPLGWACRWGRQKLTELLIARGAPIDEPDAEPWATPEAWAEKMKQEAILTLLREQR